LLKFQKDDELKLYLPLHFCKNAQHRLNPILDEGVEVGLPTGEKLLE